MSDVAAPRMTRANLPKGECLCDHCPAKCCRYFALPIDIPETLKDYDYIRWFLLHEKATVFVEEEHWYLLVHTVCKHLQPDNRCGIYMTRPEICREYSTDNCEYDDDCAYEKYFETADQVAEYVEATIGHPGLNAMRSPEPAGLPILA